MKKKNYNIINVFSYYYQFIPNFIKIKISKSEMDSLCKCQYNPYCLGKKKKKKNQPIA